MHASEFWRSIRGIAEDTATKYKPFRAKATSANNSGVLIQPYGSDALGERYAQLRGPDIKSNDEVAVIPYGGSNLVLGSVGNGPVDYTNAVSFRGTTIQPSDFYAYSADASLVPSSTVTVTYIKVYEYTIPIDNGFWSFQGFGGCQVRHLSNNHASCYVQINTAYRALNKMSTSWSAVQGSIRTNNTEITNGQYVVSVNVMTGQTGGMEMSSPWFAISARRMS